ncbi:MAG: hypothetical protein ABH851_05230 [Methanobacteriota archaeon]
MDCTFCSKKIEKGTGLIHINRAGKALNFCSSKCRRNQLDLKRKPRKVKWTKTYREEKEIRVRAQTQVKETQTPVKEKKEETPKPIKTEKKKSKPTPVKKASAKKSKLKT